MKGPTDHLPMRFDRRFLVMVIRFVLGALFAITSHTAFAFTFVPTADEWATWPAFCRARYVTFDYLVTAELQDQVSQAEIEHWKTVLGPTAFLHVHHYCAALSVFNQAMTDNDPADRQSKLVAALTDGLYTLERIGSKDPLAPEVVSLVARIQIELGRSSDAEKWLAKVIADQPAADRPYLVLAMIKRKAGNTQVAVDVLEQANRATDFKSAEINYTLGLLYFDRHDYVSARECATRAYSLGYPLPGLKNKLIGIGQ